MAGPFIDMLFAVLSRLLELPFILSLILQISQAGHISMKGGKVSAPIHNQKTSTSEVIYNLGNISN
ncbi:hypothetical protein [Providencia sp. PROV039]|uniref:hypothetical protein n=1 Tax=Providencia sp. PROV039 TaxID=2949770 RepID=UPI00234BCDF0|nr:hypothetical protein [Providencia sp. PROV039]